MKILVINPGSTSTKIAIFQGLEIVLEKNIAHSAEELARFKKVSDQLGFRFLAIQETLKEAGQGFLGIDAVAARGGILKAVKSGVYFIDEAMAQDLRSSRAALHASCLAGLIGYDLFKKYGIPAYVADPVVVDELWDVARLTGIPEVSRISVFHALNQKAAAKLGARQLGKNYEASNLVVAHLGGGISVAAHKEGRVVDVNNAIAGEGPYSPQRIGTIAPLQVAELIFEKGYTYEGIKGLTSKKGGLVAYLGTHDLRAVESEIENGNDHAQLIFDGMAYQVAKEIGSMAAALGGVDGIVLTGGLAHSKNFVAAIASRVAFLGPLLVYPGEFELLALAQSVRDVLLGKIMPKTYSDI